MLEAIAFRHVLVTVALIVYLKRNDLRAGSAYRVAEATVGAGWAYFTTKIIRLMAKGASRPIEYTVRIDKISRSIVLYTFIDVHPYVKWIYLLKRDLYKSSPSRSIVV
jgi:hypothetical protein